MSRNRNGALTNAELDEEVETRDAEAEIEALAGLREVAYQKKRKQAAANLRMPVGTLDKLVAKRRAKLEAETPPPTPERWQLEPWEDPVAGAELLDDLRKIYERYLILPEHGSVTMALWVMHAWAIDAAYVSPFLMFSSPEMRCGKSTAMALLSRTAPRTAMASNITSAAIFRYIEAFCPTLLIDEAELICGRERGTAGDSKQRPHPRQRQRRSTYWRRPQTEAFLDLGAEGDRVDR